MVLLIVYCPAPLAYTAPLPAVTVSFEFRILQLSITAVPGCPNWIVPHLLPQLSKVQSVTVKL
jgi:hypothetical protein